MKHNLSYKIKISQTIIVILFLLAAIANADKTTPLIAFDPSSGNLTVDILDMPTTDVFKQVAQEAGVEVMIGDGIKSTISAKFESIPLEKGVKKLLRGINHALIFNEKSELLSVRILPEGKGGFIRTGPSSEERESRRAARKEAASEMRKAKRDIENGLDETIEEIDEDSPPEEEGINPNHEMLDPASDIEMQERTNKRRRIGPPKKDQAKEKRKDRKKKRNFRQTNE